MDKRFAAYAVHDAGQVDLHVRGSGISIYVSLSAEEARDISMKLASRADIVDPRAEPAALIEKCLLLPVRIFRWFYPSRR